MTYQMKIDENLNTISKSVEECFFNSFEHRLESTERNAYGMKNKVERIRRK